jgi:diphthamide synthase (EF-2-diphthine--ammonia ligase)
MNELKKEKVMLFWSGGKKSAMALHYIKDNPQFEIIGLITIIDQEKNTVPFHGVPDSLLIEQAKKLKLPLQRIFLNKDSSQVEQLLKVFIKRGITTFAFGGLFQENRLLPSGLNSYFPLEGKTTIEIDQEFLSLGHKALVTSIDTSILDNSFLNCEFNQDFIERLPQDPNKTIYHTFVIFCPGFHSRIAFSKSIAINEDAFLVSLLKEP